LDDVKVIKIIDKFFDNKILKNIQDHISTKIYFTPRYFKEKERTIENYYGSRFKLSEDKVLLDTFVKETESKFKIKIKKIGSDSGIDLRNTDRFRPHTDPAKVNILIMLKGPKAVTNGTVFYTEKELDIHIGFMENRAIMFPSNKFHSAHATNIPNLKRYTATLFLEDYEE
jgi:hypothetical protein